MFHAIKLDETKKEVKGYKHGTITFSRQCFQLVYLFRGFYKPTKYIATVYNYKIINRYIPMYTIHVQNTKVLEWYYFSIPVSKWVAIIYFALDISFQPECSDELFFFSPQYLFSKRKFIRLRVTNDFPFCKKKIET